LCVQHIHPASVPVCVHTSLQAWVRYAKFEMQNGKVGLARQCYERAVEDLGEDAQTVRVHAVCAYTFVRAYEHVCMITITFMCACAWPACDGLQ